MYNNLAKSDTEVLKIIQAENDRQNNNLEMIASENFVSRSVLEAYTSTLTNKYAEGYPGKRYYNGCDYADEIENLAMERIKKVFGAEYANVQPHSGAQANMAVFMAALKPGEFFLGMSLAHGGHLSHGLAVNFSGRFYHPLSYGVDEKNHRIDYDAIASIAKEHKPKMIIAGASAYPRQIDFARFQEIAESIGAVVMTDMAHIAGLVAAGLHPSPVGISDFITSTTHKTLRGPRGGIILSSSENEKVLKSRVFPGVQGGPLMHVIAAKAVAFGEALKPEFKEYMTRVVENAKTLANVFLSRGFKLVSGGTDNHLILVDVSSKGGTGKVAADRLDEAGITVNKNGIPFDPHPPTVTSGIRIGTPALTTRGFGESEIVKVGNLICNVLENVESDVVLEQVSGAVSELAKSFPMSDFRLE